MSDIKRKTVSVVGMGYVGLCLSACLAKLNTPVICVDVDKKRIEQIKSGISPIHEDQLPEFLQMGVEDGIISATVDTEQAVLNSDITFICVGTPTSDMGYIDLSQIHTASKNIGKVLKKKSTYHAISVKSTVIPGTTDSHVIPIIERESGKKAGKNFGVCMTPEFLREGAAIYDFLNPDKIIIGAIDDRSYQEFYEVFQDFHEQKIGKNVFLRCDLRTAEMIKYANNSFLATKVSFINEMANISALFGVDIKIVSKALGMDNRISKEYLNAGLGFGGSCFPKDVKALYNAGKEAGYISKILDATLQVNENQPYYPITMLKEELGDLQGKLIGLLGLSFKPNTDDVRFAPSIKIAKKLLDIGAILRVYDPVAKENFRKESGIAVDAPITYCDSALEAIRDTEGVLIVTEWDEFSQIKPNDFKRSMKKAIIIDGRRIFDPNLFENMGVIFKGIGFSTSRNYAPT
ncbi:MAG: UDP-glucose/GDP-mannose dehydrogenase family protein [Candidatus Lokiarchaeota archaeon]|nr:UDP-glucose/GDP-mannose dehydrogenase family protein [Candidatus Lokiarchaeota archaeon]